MTFRRLTASCGAVLLSLAAHFAVAADASPHWVISWATALQPIPQQTDLPPLYRAPDVAGRTVRQVVYPTLSGAVARLHVSNEYGRAPLVIDGMRIARSASGAAARPGTDVRVTFAGRASVTVPAGAEIDSDPMRMDIEGGAPYAISSYMGGEQRMVAWHRVSNQVNYVSTPGDHASDAGGEAFRERFTQYAWVTGLAVEAPAAGAIAAIGDSITDGMRSSLNQNRRWPDALARRLAGSGDRAVAVVNLGISGNRLLSDSRCYGDALVRRFDRDVLQKPGVQTVVLLIGINDINFAAMPSRAGLDCDAPHTVVTANDLINGYRDVISAAHHRGLIIFGATLTPASLPAQREAIRQAVNKWIRTSHTFDGVIDFSEALQDPAAPEHLRRSYDSGDHIHPSDAGYAAMAAAIPLAEVAGARAK